MTIRGCLQRDQKLRPTIAPPQRRGGGEASASGRLSLLEDAFLKPHRQPRAAAGNAEGSLLLSEAQVREAVAAGAAVGAAAARKLGGSGSGGGGGDGTMGAAAQWAAVKTGVVTVVERVKAAAAAEGVSADAAKTVTARELARDAVDEISKLRQRGQQQQQQQQKQRQRKGQTETKTQQRAALPTGLGAMLGDAKAKLRPAARRRQQGGAETKQKEEVLADVFRKELAKRKVQVAGAEEDWTQAM